jgi:hypothetical protein
MSRNFLWLRQNALCWKVSVTTSRGSPQASPSILSTSEILRGLSGYIVAILERHRPAQVES